MPINIHIRNRPHLPETRVFTTARPSYQQSLNFISRLTDCLIQTWSTNFITSETALQLFASARNSFFRSRLLVTHPKLPLLQHP
ncbi:hypothetical protein Q31a_32100 [Aureliella helgolandensis]|uniref:Uncharacterized protein n=1 Tax=Aureliella helgolandensis TaxID=2527968 RepID=A0A518G8H3_9BACT|nr:hypothetical protein Q31a_32100 [Aureliella helgolandensis]